MKVPWGTFAGTEIKDVTDKTILLALLKKTKAPRNVVQIARRLGYLEGVEVGRKEGRGEAESRVYAGRSEYTLPMGAEVSD